MKSLDTIVVGNEAYRALQHDPELSPAAANTLAHVIHNAEPVYSKIGAQVCRELIEITGDDPDYTGGEYYVATYDALADTTNDEAVSDISRRALRRLLTQPSLAEMEAMYTTPAAAEIAPIDELAMDSTGSESALSAPPEPILREGEIERETTPELEPESETVLEDTPEPLTHQQRILADHELCQRVAAGDKEAATELLMQHQGIIRKYVNSAARLLRGGVMDYDDLYQETCIYILGKTAKYSLEKHNVRFTSYAGSFLDKRLRRIVDDQFAVYIPPDVQITINNIRRADEGRVGYRQGIMDEAQIAKEFDIREGAPTETGTRTTGTYRQAILLTRFMLSLDDGFGNHDNNSPGREYALDARMELKPVTSGEIPQPEDALEAAEIVKEIHAMLHTLSEREAGVIRLRFGLTDGEPRTLDEIGQVYGVTRDRIRQIESKAMSKLRHPIRSGKLRDYVIETDEERERIVALRKEREQELLKAKKEQDRQSAKSAAAGPEQPAATEDSEATRPEDYGQTA